MIRQEGVTVTIEGPGGYRVVDVESESNPNTRYKVLLACGCEGFRYRHYCKHLSQAATLLRVNAPRRASWL